ncbi:relaxase/mobilization nuclease domain-containing protein, partial [Pseudomonas helleri]
MIVKFHARGTGGGKGPTQYLLGRDGQREGATLLRGDPEQVAELIDSSRYAKKYTSGVLSFAEADLPPEQKRALMDSFEKALLPGLEARQYSCLWVEHQDKGRLELNFVIPNLELTEGKRLQPYYHVADQRRVDAWATVQRAELGLSDPKDPARRRALVTPRDLPPERQQVAQQITDGLLALAAQGEVRSRADVLEKLTGAGFQVARETKSSISIADPDGGKNIRLKGALYERDFRLG